MRIFNYILLSGSLLAFLSCEKIIEPKDLPEQEPRIVLNSILSTDSVISATISSSKSILSGKDYKYINNAVCEVYEDGVYVQNLVFTGNGNYTSSVLPKAGKKYTIKVAASGFESVSAVTSIPATVVTTGAEVYDTAGITYSRYWSNGRRIINGGTKIRFKIIDDASAKNHYHLSAFVKVFDSLGQAIPYEYIYPHISSSNTPFFNGYLIDLGKSEVPETKEIQIDVAIRVSFDEIDQAPRVKRIEVFLRIIDQNEDYYKYKQTFLDQADTRGGLFAEPVQVYTNIDKGMGILAGESITNIPVFSGPIVNE